MTLTGSNPRDLTEDEEYRLFRDGPALDPIDPDPAQDQDAILSPPTVASGATLLPPFAARLVTTTTKTAQIGVAYTAFAGHYLIKASQMTTMASLGLGRAVTERLLASAGRTVVDGSRTNYSQAEAEYILGWTFQQLHRIATTAQLFAGTLFEFTNDSMNALAGTSLFTLNLLNNLLGSTESSKAVAAIIALVHKEIQNPTTGADGEQVGYIDLVLGLCGMAYLQSCCHMLTEEENIRLRVEEIIWDVVVVKGQTMTVQEKKKPGPHSGVYKYMTGGQHKRQRSRRAKELEAPPGDASTEQSTTALTSRLLRTPEDQLQREIAEFLPADATVKVSTSTTRTITVEVSSDQRGNFAPLPGMVVVEEEKVETPADGIPGVPTDRFLKNKTRSTYRTVYRMMRNETRSTQQQRADRSAEKSGEASNSRVAGARGSEPSTSDESTPRASSPTETEAVLTPPPVPPKSPAPRPRSPVAQRPQTTPQTDKPEATQTTPRSSQLPVLKQTTGNAANQKRLRQSPSNGSLHNAHDCFAPVFFAPEDKKGSQKDEPQPRKSIEKRPSFRSVLRKGTGPSISSLLQKQAPAAAKQKPQARPVPDTTAQHQATAHGFSTSEVPQVAADRRVALIPKRNPPPPPTERKVLGKRPSQEEDGEIDEDWIRRSRETEDDQVSIISTADVFSVHSWEDSSCFTPRASRNKPRTPVSPTDSPSRQSRADAGPVAVLRKHERMTSKDYSPSIYTLDTNNSQASLAMSSYFPRSNYGSVETLKALQQDGVVDGMFPQAHLIWNISRYMRFSSAVYGSNFLRVMGLSTFLPDAMDNIHNEIQTYAHHTGLDTSSILVSSFVDPQGGSDMTGSTDTGVPLVHCISVDTDAKAVVLACRGTLGFEDVLADITCVYDLLVWRGKAYSVHKGFHASARRLLHGGADGRVMATLRAALEQNPDYGLVLCGHSLGGAVTALLGVMLAEPDAARNCFVTRSNNYKSDDEGSGLPPGRPIHVFAYGPPATMSEGLRKATRGLVTSVVHGQDTVPYLSLGTVHDVRAVCLAFMRDNNDAKAEVRHRLWRVFERTLSSAKVGGGGGGGGVAKDQQQPGVDDRWCYAALKTLRASMLNLKLVPPGEVLSVECGVLGDGVVGGKGATAARGGDGDGDGEGAGMGGQGGEEDGARRVVLRWVRDVEARFREIRIGASMLTDHSPSRYEDALEKLRLGMGVGGG